MLKNNTDLMRKMNQFYAKSMKSPAYNETQEFEIIELLDRRVKTETVRDGLWAEIKNRFENAPKCKAINDILNEAPNTYNQSFPPNTSVGMSAPQIYAEIQDIRHRQFSEERLSNTDVEFLATWEMVEYYWESMADAGKNIESISHICEKVRIMVERGEEVPMLNTRGKDNLEAYILTAFKNKIMESNRKAS